MKRVKSKYSLILACVMAACTVLFWVVYCFRGQELRFLLSGFVTFAWGVVSVYDAFHKSPSRSVWPSTPTSGTCTWP